MPKRYFIADTHFGHEKIMCYENRPFDSVVEMDESIIENWNKTIQDDDDIYVLGDYSFYGFEKTKEITQRLKGKKYLIMGNHDEENEETYRNLGFVNAYKYPIILDGFWILSHAPVYINKNMPYANLYGHVHSSSIYADASIQSFCVCVERIDYTPIEFNQVKETILQSIKK